MVLSYLTTTPSTRTGFGAPTIATRDRQQLGSFAGMAGIAATAGMVANLIVADNPHSAKAISAKAISAKANKVWPLSPQDGSTG